METIMTYIALWAPSIISFIGIAATVITALAKFKEAVAGLTQENLIQSVAKSEEQLREEIKALINQNSELTKANKYLVDRITKIQDYVDSHK